MSKVLEQNGGFAHASFVDDVTTHNYESAMFQTLYSCDQVQSPVNPVMINCNASAVLVLHVSVVPTNHGAPSDHMLM